MSPSYRFLCKECKLDYFDIVPMGTDHTECPECGAFTERVFCADGGSFLLKGGGWYADGYNKDRND